MSAIPTNLGEELVPLSLSERMIIAAALELSAELADALAEHHAGGRRKRDLARKIRGFNLEDLALLDETTTVAPVETAELPGVTRAQELAAAAMAAKHGRSGVRRQADGSVVITGMADDVELESVCVEMDGRERWRKR